MNVLGIIFDSKLNWNEHIATSIKKSNKALHAIRLIKQYFNPPELKRLLLSYYYYPILYYNSEIWLSTNINAHCKQQLLSASANALRSCFKTDNRHISFESLHKHCKKSTPNQLTLYNLSLLLYKVFNETNESNEWLHFTNQIISGSRQQRFEIYRTNNYTIGNNVLCNRLFCINKRIELNLLNLPYPLYKRCMKKEFLLYEI